MPVHLLVLAPAAQVDLKDIYQYGLRTWGQSQSDSYLSNIKKQLWALTEQPLVGIDRAELLVGARSLTIESHTLFYRVTPDTIQIIRILHGRQDPQRHLK